MFANDRACPRVTRSDFHGKEEVDGSSPSEGLISREYLQIRELCCLSSIAEHLPSWEMLRSLVSAADRKVPGKRAIFVAVTERGNVGIGFGGA